MWRHCFAIAATDVGSGTLCATGRHLPAADRSAATLWRHTASHSPSVNSVPPEVSPKGGGDLAADMSAEGGAGEYFVFGGCRLTAGAAERA